jgi:hypothetical protein
MNLPPILTISIGQPRVRLYLIHNREVGVGMAGHWSKSSRSYYFMVRINALSNNGAWCILGAAGSGWNWSWYLQFWCCWITSDRANNTWTNKYSSRSESPTVSVTSSPSDRPSIVPPTTPAPSTLEPIGISDCICDTESVGSTQQQSNSDQKPNSE